MVDSPLFKNNAISSLAADITAGSLTISLSAGDGALFPAPDVYEYAVLTLRNIATNTREIVHCTGRTSDTLTIERGQESTTPAAFSAGDEVSMQITAGLLEYLRDN